MSEYRILIVLGEVLEENQKLGFQNEILGGLYSCPSKSLEQLAAFAKQLPSTSSVTTTPEGHVISRASDQITLKVICRPTSAGLVSAITTFLKPQKDSPNCSVTLLIVYAGLMAETSAHWVLPSVIFTPSSLVDLVELAITETPKHLDVENQPMVKPFHIHVGCNSVPSGGEWRQLVGHKFPSTLGGHPVSVTVNKLHTLVKPKPTASGDAASPPVATNPPDLSQLIESILLDLPSPYYPCPGGSGDQLMPGDAADLTGLTLQVPKPCLYVFPEGSGQASIFALPGYNLLVNAGCARRPTFLPVAAHLERLDSVLLTHWGVDNLLGIGATLPTVFTRQAGQRESTLCLLAPPPANQLQSPCPGHENGGLGASSPLCLNLPRRVTACIGQLKKTGTSVIVHQLMRGAKMAVAPSKPIQLYHKIGHGTLELFTLTPTDDDSAEIRKLSDDWSKAAPAVISSTVPLAKAAVNVKATVPLLSYTSVSALVVWRPAFEFEPILRLLFVSPLAHQSRVIASLEAMSSAHLYLRHPKATTVAQPSAEADRRRSTAAAISTGLGPRRSVHPTSNAQAGKPLPPVAPKRPNAVLPAASTTPRGKEGHSVPPAASLVKHGGATKREDPGARKAKVPHPAVATGGGKPAVNAEKTSALGKAGVGKGGRAVAPASSAGCEETVPSLVSTEPESVSPSVPTQNGHLVNGGGLPEDEQPFEAAAQRLVSEVISDARRLSGDHLAGDDADSGCGGAAAAALDCPQSGVPDHVEDLHLASRPQKPALEAEGDEGEVGPVGNSLADWGAPLGLPSPVPPTGASQKHSTNRPDIRPSHAPKPPSAARSSAASAGTGSAQAPANKGYTDASAYASASATSKLAPYDRIKPVYVDVAYLPGGGNSHLVDAEFFKRVRARYYVATDARPSAALMEALATGKESWTGEDAHLTASLVLAHESSEVIPWLSANSGRLSACHLGVDAVASRSGIQLSSQTAGQQQPITCPGYRIDF